MYIAISNQHSFRPFNKCNSIIYPQQLISNKYTLLTLDALKHFNQLVTGDNLLKGTITRVQATGLTIW